MIEIRNDALRFSFPEVHPAARLRLDFQRTLRIPDDGREHFLPPGLGRFPLEHVDDHGTRLPRRWLERGGVMLPLYQAEALWLHFAAGDYPIALKVAAGKINAVSGEAWSESLHSEPQDYLAAARQPWLDGFCVDKGVIRQFTAMPLGGGYSVEEQLTGAAEHGGLQLLAYPMKRERYEALWLGREAPAGEAKGMRFQISACATPDMGLAPGGRMRQEIYADPYDPEDYDLSAGSRCFVHLCNAMLWRQLTGENPPPTPCTAKEYERAGLPWFDYYDADAEALAGSERLAGAKSVATLAAEKGEMALPENESVEPGRLLVLRKGLKPGQVREWRG